MRAEIESDLPKLGAREYIQGGTIFNGALGALDREFGPGWLEGAQISSFKLERESTGNGRFLVTDEALENISPNAIFIAKRPDKTVTIAYTDEGRPFRREPYDEESFNRPVRIGDDLTGQFLLPASPDRNDFIKGVVGANKLLHQQCAGFGGPLQKVQFLYLKDLDPAPLLSVGLEASLEIRNLTKKVTDEEVWTINQVSVSLSGRETRFRLCYRAQRPR